jgi:hypothetical protein
MPNRQLSTTELSQAKSLLDEIRLKLRSLSDGDPALLFAFRRKIYKELVYDERDKPTARRNLKDQKWKQQRGLCAVCTEPLPEKYTVLDRFDAVKGYSAENTQLICQKCDVKNQESRGYA